MQTFPDSAQSRTSFFVLAGITMLGLGLRLWHLGLNDFWLDEIYSVMYSSGPISKVLSNRTGNPPTYYVLLHAWSSVFGLTEFSFRVPSVLFGTAAIWMTGIIGFRIFDRSTG